MGGAQRRADNVVRAAGHDKALVRRGASSRAACPVRAWACGWVGGGAIEMLLRDGNDRVGGTSARSMHVPGGRGEARVRRRGWVGGGVEVRRDAVERQPR